ncbi:hypothetical protein HK096_003565, partial [Nowakowskiella sp. JEL0078]
LDFKELKYDEMLMENKKLKNLHSIIDCEIETPKINIDCSEKVEISEEQNEVESKYLHTRLDSASIYQSASEVFLPETETSGIILNTRSMNAEKIQYMDAEMLLLISRYWDLIGRVRVFKENVDLELKYARNTDQNNSVQNEIIFDPTDKHIGQSTLKEEGVQKLGLPWVKSLWNGLITQL